MALVENNTKSSLKSDPEINKIDTSSPDHTVKKRNRPSLVCFPCRKKKIKCDRGKPCNGCFKNGIIEECTYDERLNNRKRPRKNNNPTAGRKPKNVLVSKSSSGNINGTLSSQNDVCVILQKSELEALQSKIKRYETMINDKILKSPGPSIESKNKAVKGNNDLVFNNSVDTYRNVIFTTHEESRPGYIPFENITSERNYMYDPNLSVTNQIHLSDLPKRENFLIGINPYDDPEDSFKSYSQSYPSNDIMRNRNLYPLSWSYSVRNSPSYKALRNFALVEKHQMNNFKAGITYDRLKKLMVPKDDIIKKTLNIDEKIVSTFQAKTDTQEEESLSGNNQTNNDPQIHKPINISTLSLGLSVLGGAKDREFTLIEQIKMLMPQKKVIWLLIRRFMLILYPFMPFLIEGDFRKSIERIIGPESYEQIVPNVKIENKVDFSQIGILLVVLRLSYLSLFHNKGSHNEKILTKKDLTYEEEERKYLLLNAVPIGSVCVAQACLFYSEKLGIVSLPMLQCAVYIRMYQIYAPEEGDGLEGGNSQIQNSTLVSMSYMLGLNREPDKNPDFKDEKLKNLYRKIWYFVLSMDYHQAYTYGAPASIRLESYDTKRPYLSESNSNLIDIEQDKTSYSLYAFISALVKGPILEIFDLYSKVSNKIKLYELTTHLNCLELGVRKIFGKTGDYISPLEETNSSYHTNKLMKIAILLKMYSFMMLNYCFLFHFYDPINSKLCFFYLKKLLAIGMNEVLPSIFALIVRGQELFGEGSDLYLNPTLIQVVTRISDICLIGIMRSNFALYKMSNNSWHKHCIKNDTNYKQKFDSTNRFITLMEKSCRVCLTAVSILSNRYYFAWEVTRSQNYYLKLVTSQEFYKKNDSKGLEFSDSIIEHMSELSDVAEIGLDELQEKVDKYCREVDIPSLFRKTEMPNTYQYNKANESSSSKPMHNSYSGSITTTTSPSSNGIPTPGSVASNGLYFTGFDDLTFDNSQEIDSIWLQMLSFKNEKENKGYSSSQGSQQTNQQQQTVQTPYEQQQMQQPYGQHGAHSEGQQSSLQNVHQQHPQSHPGNNVSNVRNFDHDNAINVAYDSFGKLNDQYSNSINTQSQYQSSSDLNNVSGHSNIYQQDNLFNYSELFQDLPLDKIFNM
ncbi:uncharacterized protein KGF55_000060 [Candida pseudojiufengensis]|uniref:uncharacterized protein n=1 Tax=Candida pseudojiufengensis TaxID=497109 RepID=UPI0022259CC8|nr:uncharacterized protein KGF55_000060 [Candida pseudojiufengensis]KAI5967828.1 hypothetical protein KGF55_000060 [Candida pseudojiufengensis]